MHSLLSSIHFWAVLLAAIVSCSCDILIMKDGFNGTIQIIGDLPALFGPALPLAGFKGLVVSTTPKDACVPPARPPLLPNYKGPFIALVRRFACTFVEKVLNAQLSGYKAVIVRNVGSNVVEVMSGDESSQSVIIPSVFVGEDDGLFIEEHYQYDSGYYVIITNDLPFNIQNYLIPFAITIGVCFVLMLSLMLVKCIRDYRRTRRYRLSSRALKKLPIHKFKKGDLYECCAICLEDYVDNDKLRILPCSHAYHSKCIDPWLTKNRRVCPVCKRKVITGDERASDFESDSEDETAPLINSEGGTQGGTFAQQRENPFQEAERQATRRRQEEHQGRGGSGGYSRISESDEETVEGQNKDEPFGIEKRSSLTSERERSNSENCLQVTEGKFCHCDQPFAIGESSDPSLEEASGTQKQGAEVNIAGVKDSSSPPVTPKECVV